MDPKKKREIEVFVVVALVVGGALAYYALSDQVTVTAENVNVTYAGIYQGYFGPASQSLCRDCPYTAQNPLFGTTTITITITLTNDPTLGGGQAHSVDAITVNDPFTITSTSPSLPVSVSPGGTTSIAVQVQTPSHGGTFTLTLTETTN